MSKYALFPDDSTPFVQEYPDINSNNPDERKLARNLRIQNRVKALQSRRSSETSSISQTELQEVNELTEQLLKNNVAIDKYIQELTYDSKKHLLENNESLSSRRFVRREKLREILELTEEAAKEAEEGFQKVASKWLQKQNLTDPLKIHQLIQEETKKFEQSMKKKDTLIAKLKEEIKRVAEDFHQKNKTQIGDIEKLEKTINGYTHSMKDFFETKFESIEEIIKRQRNEEINKRYETSEGLFKRVEEKAQKLSDLRMRYKADIASKIQEDTEKFEEYFRHCKMSLQNDVGVCLQQLENMKFVTQRHIIALSYNTQVIELRREENIIRRGLHRRIVMNQQLEIAGIKRKLQERNEHFKVNWYRYKKDVEKLKKDILLIETKADRLMKLGEYNFMKTWKMAGEECRKIIEKIEAADKILHEQKMGISIGVHIPNMKSFFDISRVTGYSNAIDIIKMLKSGSLLIDPKSNGKAKLTKFPEDEPFMNAESLPAYKRLAKYILMTMSDKSGFLNENRIRELIKTYEDDKQSLVRLDQLFYFIGVNNPKDVDILVRYFHPYCFCLTCNAENSVLSDMSFLSSLSGAPRTSTAGVPQSVVSETFSHVTNVDNMLGGIALHQAFFYCMPSPSLIEEVIVDVVNEDRDLRVDFKINDKNYFDDEEMVMSLLENERVSKVKPVRSIRQPKSTGFFCVYQHDMVIMTCYILEALKTFVADSFKIPKPIPTMNERLLSKRNTAIRLLEDKNIKLFWENIINIYNRSTVDLWDNFAEGINNYYAILCDRKKLSEEVVDLRMQNRNLKKILEKYRKQSFHFHPACNEYHEKIVLKSRQEVKPLCKKMSKAVTAKSKSSKATTTSNLKPTLRMSNEILSKSKLTPVSFHITSFVSRETDIKKLSFSLSKTSSNSITRNSQTTTSYFS